MLSADQKGSDVLVGGLLPPESEEQDRQRWAHRKRQEGDHVVSPALKLAKWRGWEEGQVGRLG